MNNFKIIISFKDDIFDKKYFYQSDIKNITKEILKNERIEYIYDISIFQNTPNGEKNIKYYLNENNILVEKNYEKFHN